MSIYNFSKVTNFLEQHGAELVYPAQREFFFKTNHSTLYSSLLEATSFLTKPSFMERLYCFTNNIKAKPTCRCGNEVTFSRIREYHTYCSPSCSLTGVDNSSRLASVKQKKKDSALKRYGVDNVSKSNEVRIVLADKKRAYWDKVYQHKQFSIGGLSRKQYKHRAQQHATTQYNRHKDLLDPLGIKGKDWHIDHIYSMTDGFINDVPINIISHVSNLRLISAKENYAKNKSSHKTLEALYEDYSQSSL